MGSWWNPLTWLKLVSMVTSFLEGIKSLYNAYLEKKKKEQQEKQLDQINDAVNKIEEANKIEDEHERLKRKAEAAKAIEDSIVNVPR